jgi:hypothetical protein
MSTPRSRIDDVLAQAGELPAPPPSAALESLVANARPVPRRRPVRTLALVLLASVLLLAIHVRVHGLRHDLAYLPAWWFWAMSLAWLAAFATPLAIALLPRKGSMFADSRAATVAAYVVPAAALVLTLFLRIDAPPATVIPVTTEKTIRLLSGCLLSGLEMGAAPFAIGVLVLRHAPQPLTTRWIGAALGAANGALAALMLHMHCWVGGALHTGVAHAGQALIGAVIGALLVPVLTRRPAK